MKNQHLMVIDPAVIKPAIESYNRISLVAPFPVTYHLPALHGFTSIEQVRGNISGIIVMGSAASVHDGHSWQDVITELILDAIENNIPVMGICYGHQLLAHIFGGTVSLLWNGEKKQGQRNVNLNGNMLWGAPRSGPMIFSHQEGVTKCPYDFEITAVSELVAIDGFASKTKPIWGFQTHIEATQAFIDDHNVPNVNSHESFEFGHRVLDNFILSLT
jgi:GMP synthase (glutamine-hydrolysing)